MDGRIRSYLIGITSAAHPQGACFVNNSKEPNLYESVGHRTFWILQNLFENREEFKEKPFLCKGRC